MFKRITKYIGPTLLCFVLVEATARFSFDGSESPVQPDEVLNHVWKPNYERLVDRFTSVGIPPYKKITNSQNWLSTRDYSPIKNDKTFRIIYVGDSFTEGTCDVEQTLPAIVEKELTMPPGHSVEVINTGTSSYSPTLYYLLLKTRLLRFNPDLIVMNVDMTDVFDDSLYRETLETDEAGDPIACHPGHPALETHRRTARGLEELTSLQQVVLQLAKVSKAFELLLIKVMQSRKHDVFQAGQVPPLFAWCALERDEKVDGDVRWSMLMLRRGIRLAKSKDIKIVVTAVPHLQQFQGHWSLRPMEELERLCKEEKIPFLNPISEMRQRLGATPLESIYIPGDMHFNATGYRLWADVQLSFLSKLTGTDFSPPL